VSITEIFPADDVVGLAPRRAASPALPPLPVVAPGQLWLVELPDTGAVPAPARHVLDHANVVIYDRSLAGNVAEALPLGGYAEPASDAAQTAARAARFARDGWSVARLLPARLAPRERTRRVQDVVDALAAAAIAGRLPVTILAEAADGIEERTEARFDELTAVVARHPRDTRLAIVIDTSGAGGAARLHAVAANGLAG
jgi:hypothetical protein